MQNNHFYYDEPESIKKFRWYSILCVGLILFFSCKKDKNPVPTDPLLGIWKVVSINGNAEVTKRYRRNNISFRDEYKYTFFSRIVYGSFQIFEDRINAVDFSHETAIRFSVDSYENNVLKNKDSTGHTAGFRPVQPYHYQYRKVDIDSLYFYGGLQGNEALVSYEQITAAPTTGSYKIEGNKLTITSGAYYVNMLNYYGSLDSKEINTIMTVVLERK